MGLFGRKRRDVVNYPVYGGLPYGAVIPAVHGHWGTHSSPFPVQLLKTPEQELFDAAKNGEQHKIQHLLTYYPGLLTVLDCDGNTALKIAARENHTCTAETILSFAGTPEQKACLVNQANHDGYTPLLSSIIQDNEQLFHLFIQAGADLHHKTCQQKGPVFLAAENGRNCLLRYLLDIAKLPADEHNKPYAATPLHWAASKGHVITVSILLSRGADPNRADSKGKIPYGYADNKDIQELLRGHCHAHRDMPLHYHQGSVHHSYPVPHSHPVALAHGSASAHPHHVDSTLPPPAVSHTHPDPHMAFAPTASYSLSQWPITAQQDFQSQVNAMQQGGASLFSLWQPQTSAPVTAPVANGMSHGASVIDGSVMASATPKI